MKCMQMLMMTYVDNLNIMNKKQFLKRCEANWDKWVVNQDMLLIMRDSVEFMSRFLWWQPHIAIDILNNQKERTDNCAVKLANDTDLYWAMKFTYNLCHPCDKCAEDPMTWETRYWFCSHKKYF